MFSVTESVVPRSDSTVVAGERDRDMGLSDAGTELERVAADRGVGARTDHVLTVAAVEDEGACAEAAQDIAAGAAGDHGVAVGGDRVVARAAQDRVGALPNLAVDGVVAVAAEMESAWIMLPMIVSLPAPPSIVLLP